MEVLTEFFFPKGACLPVLMQSLTDHLGSAWRFLYESGTSSQAVYNHKYLPFLLRVNNHFACAPCGAAHK